MYQFSFIKTTWFTLVVFSFVTLLPSFPWNTNTAYAQSAGFSFQKDLSEGDNNSDVRELQRVLNKAVDTRVANTGSGSPGLETTYFGGLTKSAVIKFQEKYRAEILTPNGLTSGTGYVGKSTRSKLNTLLGGVTLQTSSTQANTSAACQLLEQYIASGVIPASSASLARANVGCTTSSVTVSANAPSVTFTANLNADYTGTYSAVYGQFVTLTWVGLNVKSCTDGANQIGSSGSKTTTLNISTSYVLTCTGVDGTQVSKTINITVYTGAGDIVTTNTTSGSQSNVQQVSVIDGTVVQTASTTATTSISVLSSSITPSTSTAAFIMTTSVPTVLTISYTSDPTGATNVVTVQQSTTTVHSGTITNLLPGTTYYAVPAYTADGTAGLISDGIVFTTLASSSAVASTTLEEVASTTASTTAGYAITFKGAVRNITSTDSDLAVVQLKKCNNPAEDIIKGVTADGSATSKSASSYYDSEGSVLVTIPYSALGVSVPSKDQTINGTAEYVTQTAAGAVTGNNSSPNWIGYMTSWSPDGSDCYESSDGLGGINWATVIAVVAIAACATGIGCVFGVGLSGLAGAAGTTLTVGVGTAAVGAGATYLAASAVVSATAAYTVGSLLQDDCDGFSFECK